MSNNLTSVQYNTLNEELRLRFNKISSFNHGGYNEYNNNFYIHTNYQYKSKIIMPTLIKASNIIYDFFKKNNVSTTIFEDRIIVEKNKIIFIGCPDAIYNIKTNEILWDGVSIECTNNFLINPYIYYLNNIKKSNLILNI